MVLTVKVEPLPVKACPLIIACASVPEVVPGVVVLKLPQMVLKVTLAADPKADELKLTVLASTFVAATPVRKLTLLNAYPDEHPVTLVQGAGTANERVWTVPLHALDHVATFCPARDGKRWREAGLDDLTTLAGQACWAALVERGIAEPLVRAFIK